MSVPGHARRPDRERGAALIALLLAVVLASSYFLLREANSVSSASLRAAKTAAAMAQAKEALIAHAVTYPEQHLRCTDSADDAVPCDSASVVNRYAAYVPGPLPCPELDSSLADGTEAGNCGAKGVSSIGRLPWRSLDLQPRVDDRGDCLWYAVSGSFKASPKPDLLNWDSRGQFRLIDATTGNLLADGVVAVVFAPGSPLANQDRSTTFNNRPNCGDSIAATQYLDRVTVGATTIDNATPSSGPDAVTTFAVGQIDSVLNDQLAWITVEDLINRGLRKRNDFPGTYLFREGTSPLAPDQRALAQRLTNCLRRFADNSNSTPNDLRLPWAAPLAVTAFDNASFNDVTNNLSGRPPFIADHSGIATANSLFTGCPTANSSNSACRLLRVGDGSTNGCGADWKPVAGDPEFWPTNSLHGWWDKWKDHYFYAVAAPFAPTNTAPARDTAANPTPCDAGGCFTIDGAGPYSAVVIFAGERLPLQQRDGSNKLVLSNYLEGANIDALDTSKPTYGKFSRVGSNDRFVCLSGTLPLTVVNDCDIPPSCSTLKSSLSSHISVDENTCAQGGSAVNPSCAALVTQIGSSCPSNCIAPAQALIKAPCLNNPSTSQCLTALSTLSSC